MSGKILMSSTVLIRDETEADTAAIGDVTVSSFKTLEMAGTQSSSLSKPYVLLAPRWVATKYRRGRLAQHIRSTVVRVK